MCVFGRRVEWGVAGRRERARGLYGRSLEAMIVWFDVGECGGRDTIMPRCCVSVEAAWAGWIVVNRSGARIGGERARNHAHQRTGGALMAVGPTAPQPLSTDGQ